MTEKSIELTESTEYSDCLENQDIEIPLWYLVKTHELGFENFAERFKSRSFTDREIFPIFVLNCIYQHDPYLANGNHVLYDLFSNQIITESVLRCLYFYWILGKDRLSENVVESGNHLGKFSSFSIILPPEFNKEYLLCWMRIFIKSFLPIGVFPKLIKYQSGNLKQLFDSIDYYKQLQEQKFVYSESLIRKMYSLSQIHNLLIEFRGFFLGKSFPQILKAQRNNLKIFKYLAYQYWPDVLKSFEIERPFNSDEINILKKAHLNLFNSDETEFLFEYIKEFGLKFPDSPLRKELEQLIAPSSKNDILKIKNFLSKLTSEEKSRVFLSEILLTDGGIQTILESIKRVGFEKIFKQLRNNYQERILFQIKCLGGELVNPELFSTGEPFSNYPLENLIFHSENNNYYIFTRNELFQLTGSQKLNKYPLNPYNRKPLPPVLFDRQSEFADQSFIKMWEGVLHRQINLIEE